MIRECQLTDNGDVYEIKSDGTITNIGNINSQSNKHSYTLLWIGFISSLIAAIILGVRYNQTISQSRQEISQLNNKYDNLSHNYTSAKQNIEELTKKINEKDSIIKEYNDFKKSIENYPLIITEIEIGNNYYDGRVETMPGGYIYSSRSMYLAPKIKYVGLNQVYSTLKVKIYNSDGKLSQGSSSPYDCSYTYSIVINKGKQEVTLSGWGNSSMGHWKKGAYRIEIWNNNQCLGVKNFIIY